MPNYACGGGGGGGEAGWLAHLDPKRERSEESLLTSSLVTVPASCLADALPFLRGGARMPTPSCPCAGMGAQLAAALEMERMKMNGKEW